MIPFPAVVVPDADRGRATFPNQTYPAIRRGSLATEPRGTSGFGYDPIFIPGSDTSQRTYAQMTSEEKNKISHRRRAVEEIRNALRLP
jgi:XTP/dITP diphosphohydrolase